MGMSSGIQTAAVPHGLPSKIARERAGIITPFDECRRPFGIGISNCRSNKNSTLNEAMKRAARKGLSMEEGILSAAKEKWEKGC